MHLLRLLQRFLLLKGISPDRSPQVYNCTGSRAGCWTVSDLDESHCRSEGTEW